MFKLALVAGHYLGTPGKRCPKELDPNQTREWWLNNRICDKIEKNLANYDGIEILRIDDTTGKKDIPLKDRVAKGNAYGADLWLSIHANAAKEHIFDGGGIAVYVAPNASDESKEWQKALYKASVKETGLVVQRVVAPQTIPIGIVLCTVGFQYTDLHTGQGHDPCSDVLVKVYHPGIDRQIGAEAGNISLAGLCQNANALGHGFGDGLQGNGCVTQLDALDHVGNRVGRLVCSNPHRQIGHIHQQFFGEGFFHDGDPLQSADLIGITQQFCQTLLGIIPAVGI